MVLLHGGGHGVEEVAATWAEARGVDQLVRHPAWIEHGKTAAFRRNDEFKAWLRTECAGLSRHTDVAKAMDYMLKRWDSVARFLDDGRICLTNNAAHALCRVLVATH